MAARRWCFTLNNYTDDDEAALKAVDYRYLVYGREKGDSGTPHLQGFITFSMPRRLSALKKIHHAAHWEAAKGTSLQASEYCKKEGDFEELGTCAFQGQRNDLDSAIATLKEFGVKRVAEDHPREYVKFSRGFKDLALTLEQPYDHPTVRGIWIWGPPGTGKSHTVREQFTDIYFKGQNKWWDGYAGQTIVLLDDLDTNTLGHLLKIWSDRYACTGETKGGTIHLRHHRFIITSNSHPTELFQDENTSAHMCEAISRRFEIFNKTSQEQFIDLTK